LWYEQCKVSEEVEAMEGEEIAGKKISKIKMHLRKKRTYGVLRSLLLGLQC